MSGYSASPSPSLVSLPVQTGAKARGFSPTAPEFTAETDSPLEEERFESSVPRRNRGTLRPHSELFDPMIATHKAGWSRRSETASRRVQQSGGCAALCERGTALHG